MNFIPLPHPERPAAQRAKGQLALAFKRIGAETRVETFFQSGCLKTRLPRAGDPKICEAVTMNISGGVAGGDVLSTSIELHPGARVSIASQAAERIYRALAEPARIATRIIVHPGASLEYLPQETILFNCFSLQRSLEIDLHEGAEFLGIESLVFGRLAMGEAVNTGVLRDRITLKRDKKLILQDMTRLEGDIAAQLSRKAVANGATAMASLILATPDAPAKLERLRAALAGAHAGASAFEGILFARILGDNGAALRNIVLAALAALRDGRALPRVWQG